MSLSNYKEIVVEVILCMGVLICKPLQAQSLRGSLHGAFVYVPQDPLYFEEGAIVTGSIENFFNQHLSFGINARFGGVAYRDDYTTVVNNVPQEETELDVSNFVWSVSFFPRFSFLSTDELILSVVLEVGVYQVLSRPTIYFTELSNGEVRSKTYDSGRAASTGLGLSLQGEYFLKERLSLVFGAGWKNYDLSLAMKALELGDDFPKSLKISETDFLNVEIGISYQIYGSEKRFN